MSQEERDTQVGIGHSKKEAFSVFVIFSKSVPSQTTTFLFPCFNMFIPQWRSQKKYHNPKRKRWHSILFAVFWFVLGQKHKCTDSTDENWFCVPHREHLNSGGNIF